jgi:hypothetical protein
MPEEVQRKAELTVVLMVFTAFAALGVLLISFTVQDFARARASYMWPTVSGVVLSDPDGAASRPRYAYVVDGETYQSRRIGFFQRPFSGRAFAGLAPGQKVKIYVDPEKPSVSVLKPGGSSLVFLFMSMMAAFLIFVGFGGAIRTLMNGGAQDWFEEDGFEGDLVR